MEIIRNITFNQNEIGGFQVGDQIKIGDYCTATCQKVGKRSAVFMFDQCLKGFRSMYSPIGLRDRSKSGYKDSDLRIFLNKMAETQLFEDVQNMMIPFKKTGDLLRIPTAEEIFGRRNVRYDFELCSHKNQWELMGDIKNRISYKKMGIVPFWLQNNLKGSFITFAAVSPTGTLTTREDSSLNGVRIVFKLRNKIK